MSPSQLLRGLPGRAASCAACSSACSRSPRPASSSTTPSSDPAVLAAALVGTSLAFSALGHGRRPLLDRLGAAERRRQPGDPAARLPGRRLLLDRRAGRALAQPDPRRPDLLHGRRRAARHARRRRRCRSACRSASPSGLAVGDARPGRGGPSRAGWGSAPDPVRRTRGLPYDGRGMDPGDILRRTWELYRAHWRHLIAIAAVISCRSARSRRSWRSIGWPGILAANVLNLAAIFLVQGALVKAVEDVRDGRRDLGVAETFAPRRRAPAGARRSPGCSRPSASSSGLPCWSCRASCC